MSSNTPVASHALNPFTFPLHGRRLIEASAGTGKTYTIASLYLRLILGHGEDSEGDSSTAHPEPLSVDRILVVTFTEAATEELRDRIRARIHECRMAFITGHTFDPFIQSLLDSLDRHDDRANLLLAAERQMDEAAVFTIHGFCQRMLKQHAFESGTLFSSELVKDESDLLKQTTADFWRKTLYPLDKPMAALCRKIWKTPDDLLREIRGWLGKHDLNVVSTFLPDSMASFRKDYIEPSLAIKECWREDREDLENAILSAGLKKNSKTLNRLPGMSAFLNSDELMPNLGKNESWELYSTEVIRKALTKNGQLPEHPVFARIDALLANPLSIREAFRGLILREALQTIKEKMSALKAERHQMAFDDLLGNLSRALNAEAGEQLAEAIRKQYRVAMIDEFQDTDPQQYSIFSNIYGTETDSTSGLFMIGDPKQAIYAFRGADIFTYMQARQQVTAHYTLGTNWRSTSAMINGVNRVFEHIDAPFIYQDIPFEAVAPSPKADKLQLTSHGSILPALQLWLQEDNAVAVSKTDYEATMAQSTANEINRLLSAASHDLCLIENRKEEGQDKQPLQAGDIAVLVRTGRQGQMIREALTKQEIASVYLSNSDSVFECHEATDVLRLLSACLAPSDERVLRAALATPLLSMTAEDLDALSQDEQAWESAVEEFSDYQGIWLDKGVLPMLRTLLSRRKVAEQLLAGAFGERRLTDLLHIGELLAAASQEMESPHALLRWLSEHIHNPDSKADEQQLHLESERNLVKIITIHKSKGLEYNVVFLPFACTFRAATEPLYHDGESRESILELPGSDEAISLSDQERLAEDLRLLYVALTRAVHTCYVGVAPLKTGSGRRGAKTDLHKTAIGWLLSSGNEIAADSLPELLQNLAEEHDFITITSPSDGELPAYQPPAEAKVALAARQFSGKIQKDWWVTSYSALSHSRAEKAHSGRYSFDKSTPDASREAPGVDIEVLEEKSAGTAEGEVHENPGDNNIDELSIFNFPKGARPGTFLHSLFEKLDSENVQSVNMPGYVNEQLLLEGLEEKWTPTLVEMLQNCLDSPLDGKALKLGAIPEQSRKVEMEFYLPISHLQAGRLNHLISSSDPLSARAGELDFPAVKGMLKGFIDLVFEYGGRWYVLDYKSNWLGEQLSDYSRENMERVMIEHRYDLQYQLYSLALHRLLKTRVPDYDYDRHFGGAIYLFLRGIRSDNPERHGVYDCRLDRALIENLDRLFAGEAS